MAEKIILIGAGNVGWHLAHALDQSGYCIDQVIARHEENAKALASKFGAYFGTRPVHGSKADMVFICTGDDQIPVAAEMAANHAELLVHTSGSTPLDVLKPFSSHYGVFYPLQTFSKQRKIDFNTVPIFVEAADSRTEKALQEMAEKLSCQVFLADSRERSILHLAAVFTNNFTNHILGIASEIASKSGRSAQVLHPLMKETLAKFEDLGSHSAQTGPAARGDIKMIEKHLGWLHENAADYEEIYRMLSASIIGKIQRDGHD